MNLLSVVISSKDTGLPLFTLLRKRLKISRRLYRRLWDQGGIRLNGLLPRPFDVVNAGQWLTLDLMASTRVAPEPIGLEILHHDADLIVVNKPSGMVAHPTKDVVEGSLAAGLTHRFGAIHLVGRLDRETSGLALVARHPLAAQRLNSAVARREVERVYLALLVGQMTAAEGFVTAPIARSHGSGSRIVDLAGKAAGTYFKRLKFTKDHSLVELRLETGRTHQIRVHMAHLGYPVLGDDRYGQMPRMWHRHCLHATRLSFCHPRTGQHIELDSPWPADLPDTERLSWI